MHLEKEIHKLLQQGGYFFQKKEYVLAKNIYKKILKINRNNFDALYFQGIIEALENNNELAIDYLKSALGVSPTNIDVIYNIGLIYQRLNRNDEAIQYYNKLLLINPHHTNAHNNIGNILIGLNLDEEALKSYNLSISSNANNYIALLNKAKTLYKLQRFAEAASVFQEVIKLKKDFYEAYSLCGLSYLKAGQFEKSIEFLNFPISKSLNNFDDYINRGVCFSKLSRFKDAANDFKKSIELNPDSSLGHENLGNALRDLNLNTEALQSFEKAINLDPNNADALSNAGNILQDKGQIAEAIEYFERAINIREDKTFLYNCGNALEGLKEYDKAIIKYDQAINLDPNYADAYFGKSLILLKTGKYNEGWKLYEWRFKAHQSGDLSRFALLPGWNLEINKRVILWAEQGIGDEIMFASLIPELETLCTKLVVQIDERLVNLFKRSFSKNILFIDKAEIFSFHEYDYQISMGSLCSLLRKSNEDFKKQPQSYLIADTNNKINIDSHLKKGEKYCGVSWMSKNQKNGFKRSIELLHFMEPLIDKGYKFINLQYGVNTEDLSEFNKLHPGLLINVNELDIMKDIDGLASLIKNCNLVVTIDNSTAHLSGALGVPTYVLLPYSAEWRWGNESEKSMWYQSIRLFRQKQNKEWNYVLEEIATNMKST
jgi:tetratricopeptide (TPR) repeat protein